MIASDLPSDDDLYSMWQYDCPWVCWIYDVRGKTLRAWSRSVSTPPLDRRIRPLACIIVSR